MGRATAAGRPCPSPDPSRRPVPSSPPPRRPPRGRSRLRTTGTGPPTWDGWLRTRCSDGPLGAASWRPTYAGGVAVYRDPVDETGLDLTAEEQRLRDARHGVEWRVWGPYLSERQWGTVREDYSETGEAWDYFSHDHARSHAYRWGEDGLAGISDDKQRLCFALALWNGRDPILKERLFGLTNSEGNHGEDVKEYYFYLDNLPTHSYQRWLYKYPQAPYPYEDLVTHQPDPLPSGAGVRAGRHRDLRRAAVLRRHGRIRQGRPVRHRLPHHRRQPRPGGGGAPRPPDALVPQHLVVAAEHGAAAGAAASHDRRSRGGRARRPRSVRAPRRERGRAGTRAPVLREREQRPEVVGCGERRGDDALPEGRHQRPPAVRQRPPSTRTAKGRSARLITTSPCPRAERSCCAAG